MEGRRHLSRILGINCKTAPFGDEYFATMTKTGDKKGTEIDEAINAMEAGETFVKVWSATSSSRGDRLIRLSKDRLALHITYRKCFGSLDHKKINLKRVEEVRVGHMSEVWQGMGNDAPNKKQCFSLVVEGRDAPLNLIANSESVAKLWVLGIQHLSEKIDHLNVKEKRGVWVWQYFKEADKDKNGKLSFKEVKKLLDKINFHASDDYVKQLLKSSDTEGDQVLSFQEFIQFFRKMSWRSDIERIFKSYSDTDFKVQPKELVRFMKENWDEDYTAEQAQDLIMKMEPDPEYLQKNAMSVYGFMYLLLSEHGDIFDRKSREVYQDMTHPLSYYFVASSHNTYLVEHQLYGDSSVESYIRALDKGCRCVELDCWDGDDGDPIIYHGHTLTSKIKFEHVIKALKSYSFKSNKYPVILSMENHCSVEQQSKMATILKGVLGDSLLKQPVNEKESQLPSPKDLLEKFIVKGKKLPVRPENADMSEGDVTDEDEAADMEDEEIKNKTKNRQTKIRLSKELSDLVVYTQSCHFKGVDSVSESSYAQICSLNEDKAEKICTSEPTKFVHYNEHQLVRIYPKGTRTDSCNYDPVPFWNSGCQIVALNYQTMDYGMRMNLAKFRDNGGCGYVLKPGYLTSRKEMFNPQTGDPQDGMEITIRVISAQQLPKPQNNEKGEIIDPYIKVSVVGCSCDEQSQKTSTVKNNGFSPTWEEEELKFTLQRPHLAIMTFTAYDRDVASKDQNVGEYSLPIQCLATGYRHVHLENKKAESLHPASIFVHVTINKLAD